MAEVILKMSSKFKGKGQERAFQVGSRVGAGASEGKAKR